MEARALGGSLRSAFLSICRACLWSRPFVTSDAPRSWDDCVLALGCMYSE